MPDRQVSYNPNGDLVASASQDRSLRVWSARDGSSVAVLEGHGGPVLDLAFHTKTEWLLSASADKTLRVWRESDGVFAREIKGHKGAATCVAFDPLVGSVMATAEADGPRGRTNAAWLWSFQAGTRRTQIKEALHVNTLRGHEGRIRRVAFAPGAALLATCSDDATVRMWRLRDRAPGGAAGGGGGVARGRARGAGGKGVAGEAEGGELEPEKPKVGAGPARGTGARTRTLLWQGRRRRAGG